MKTTYIQPEIEVNVINIENVMTSTSVGTGEGEKDGSTMNVRRQQVIVDDLWEEE